MTVIQLMRHLVGWGVTVLALCGCAETLPKDSQVRAYYFERKTLFQQVVEMLREDGALGVTKHSPGEIFVIDPLNEKANWKLKISAERKEAYKKAFQSLNTEHGAFVHADASQVFFIMALRGLVTSGAYKGIAYVPRAKELQQITMVTSLDEKETLSKDGTYLVPLEADWYIYFDR